jgi:hypothetical protein
MHVRCGSCGKAIGGCAFEGVDQHQRLIQIVQLLTHGDEDESLSIVAAIEQSARFGTPLSFDAARQHVQTERRDVRTKRKHSLARHGSGPASGGWEPIPRP